MYSFNELTKRERYYLNRKKRLDEKFVWTQEKIQNLRELNDSLSLMQERIGREKGFGRVFSAGSGRDRFLAWLQGGREHRLRQLPSSVRERRRAT